MKKKSSKKSAPALCRVSLKFRLPHASTVAVAGSFNGWDATGVPLQPVGDGYWTVELDLAPGRCEFRLVVDGVWTDVPDAAETVENPFGGHNAVLVVASV